MKVVSLRATRMLLKGELAGPGVFAPEAAIEPRAFFAEMAPLCEGRPQVAYEVVEARRDE